MDRLRLSTFLNLCAGIDSQDLDQFRHLAEVSERVAGILVVTAQQIDEKDILPRTTSHGSRLDLAETDVSE